MLEAGSAAARHGIDVVYPYRDRELVDFLLRVPGDVIARGGVPKALLRDATKGVMPDEIRLRRSKGDGTAFSNQAALAAEGTLRRRFDNGSPSVAAGFVDPVVLRAHMTSIFGSALTRDDSATAGWHVADTLALDLWLERFCSARVCH